MDFRGRRHERGSNWTDPEIVELLQLWSDESVQVELESSLRNQRVFDRIAHILREKGIYRTGDQCREKIKKMKLEYRRIKDNHKMRTWKFYDVMDRVLANRPAITYSSLGGAVIAQQVFQSSGGSEAFMQGGAPASSFGPASAGGFLFGQPPKTGDPLDIKCEDAEESLLNSGGAPPEMYYASGEEQETDGQCLLEPEYTMGQPESSANTRASPSGGYTQYSFMLMLQHNTRFCVIYSFVFIFAGFSDPNLGGSAAAGGAGVMQNTPEVPDKEISHAAHSTRHRKRRRGGKASWVHGSSRLGGQGSLDKVLTSFLSWQQSAEERLLSLEEARLEREFQAEERREQREERRAEQERQHELRLFSMLTGALLSVRPAAPAGASPADPSPSSSVAPSASSSLSQSLADALPTRKTEKSPPTSVTTSKMSPSVLAAVEATAPRGPSVYLSNRGNSILQHQGILQEGFAQYGLNKHHDSNNPDVSQCKISISVVKRKEKSVQAIH